MPHSGVPELEPAASTTVHLSGDGLNLDPSEAAAEIVRLCGSEKPVADQYGLTGCVEDVEKYFAALLGKERALFMPTGTLANHLAIRALAAIAAGSSFRRRATSITTPETRARS